MSSMKAYEIKIILRNSNPSIWRKVIVPSKITFEGLHDIIQIAIGWKNSYLYDFNIVEENLRITCDEEAIDRYNFYSKIQLTEENDPYGHIAKYIEIKPMLSNNVKIDKYIMKYDSIEYVYDFGDYWKHDVILERVFEDYKGNCPICIEGTGACPPEDIGGIVEYEKFLEIINDKNHSDYDRLIDWAENSSYREIFNISDINTNMTNEFKLKNRKREN